VIPSPERQAEILASMPNAIVATIRPDGTPQLTPNWYLWTGSSFLISVTERSIKTRHLRRDPRIVLCIDDVEGGDYVQVTGTAVLIEGEAAREPTLALCRKYMAAEQVGPHWDALLAEGRRVVIEVKPVRYQWHDRAG
jgi:PPOX class probable F420-dependent enzyme